MDIGRGTSTTNVALWIVQGLLAALFLFAGGAKLVLPLDQMAGPGAPPGWVFWVLGGGGGVRAPRPVPPRALPVPSGLPPPGAGGAGGVQYGGAGGLLGGRA